eukprot:scaffold20698_cov21-Tisochrysis_lutea.AAC.3
MGSIPRKFSSFRPVMCVISFDITALRLRSACKICRAGVHFEVVECLQEVCGLRNVTKNTEDGIVQLTALADSHVRVEGAYVYC